MKPHPHTPALMAGDTLFEQTASTRVRYPIVVDTPAQIMNLLAMTPYYWNINRATRARIEALSRLELTVDAYVRASSGRRAPNRGAPPRGTCFRGPRLVLCLRLRVGDRLVVDGGADLLQAVVEQQPGLQIADLPVQVLDGVALDRGDELLADLGEA